MRRPPPSQRRRQNRPLPHNHDTDAVAPGADRLGAAGADAANWTADVSRPARSLQSASAALEALPRISGAKPPAEGRIGDEIDSPEAMGARLLAACEPDYPPLLAQLDAPPLLLAVRGDAKMLKRPAIALIGAREGSPAASMLAQQIAADLGAAGFVVVSGMARGVDAAAHKGALSTGTPAVLAGGLDHPYPPQNLKLHEAIVEKGAVVSEAPLGAVARARDFPSAQFHYLRTVAPRRGDRSGVGFRIAHHPRAQPAIRDATSWPHPARRSIPARGSNALIKQGATLIENADDIISALGDRGAALADTHSCQRF